MATTRTRPQGTRTARILAWYRDNPGFHRCTDVAKAMGEQTHPVAAASRYLWLQGEVERLQPNGQRLTLYGIDPTRPRPTATDTEEETTP